MSLREHERRILEEIERQLSEEEPDLAERLESFGTADPDAPADPGLSNWKPWVACGLIAAVTAGLLILLFVLTPSAPEPSAPESTGTSETLGDPAPDGGPGSEPGSEPAGQPGSEPGTGPVDPDPADADPAG